MQKTFMEKNETAPVRWVVLDAENQVLGRLASKIAILLRGKHRPTFTPHVLMGERVIVVNAEKIAVTGKKRTDKIYQRFSGYPGGQKRCSLETMLKKKPADVIKIAVRGMLPHTTLGREMLRRLKVYAGGEHPHQAQEPVAIS